MRPGAIIGNALDRRLPPAEFAGEVVERTFGRAVHEFARFGFHQPSILSHAGDGERGQRKTRQDDRDGEQEKRPPRQVEA